MNDLPWSWITVFAVLAYLLAGGIAAGHAIIHKRDARSALIFLITCFAIPFLGPCFYWIFGINRIRRRALSRLGRRERPFDLSDRSAVLPGRDEERIAVGDLVALRAVADRVTRLPLLSGNTIIPRHNGEETYPRMLHAINEAKVSVTLATYIFDLDDIGHAFVDALGRAARRGVHVHVLVDGVGALGNFSRMGRKLIRTGAKVAAFFPLRFPLGRLRINLRNHRKILVVDGRTGFTGGMNISDRHFVQRPGRKQVEDLHFEITGPIVAELQHAFAEDWAMATNEILEGDAYFPALSATGPACCRGISSGPDEDFEVVHWIVQAAFSAARKSVHVVTPYFVPTWSLMSAMALASLRGVEISLVLPSVVRPRYMRWVADAYLWQLLEHSIRVYRRPAPFVHTKLLIVDGRWVLLGSANLDFRSFRLDFEFNVEAYDPGLAASLTTWLDQWIAGAEPVTLEQIESRTRWQRLRDGCAKVLSPQL